MATQITEYKCPACAGPLHFKAESGKMECDYCDSVFEVAEIQALYAQNEAKAEEAFAAEEEKRGRHAAPSPVAEEGAEGVADCWDTSQMSSDWGAEAQGMRSYSCPSCAAELICDETTAATSCPYCGNNTIVPGQFGGMLKPDYVIPFKLNKDAAVAALKNHYKGKFLLPKSFTDSNHIEEMKGIYVPFWLYDAEVDADCVFEGTRSHSHKSGDYLVTITDHYHVRRAGTVGFERVPADGSSKMEDDYMDSIEPFDYSALEPFSTAYMPGYLADKYDVSAEECAGRADTRFENSALDVMRSDVVGYESVMPLSSNVNLHRGKVSYAMLPVWTLLTKWKDQNYMFMMNGQTGKLVGDLPVSMGKFWGVVAGITAVLGLALFLTGGGAEIASWIAS